MKKERQIGIRVGVPAFFALELEDVYRHTEGAHRALVFPDFLGLLIGLGLEAYRKGNTPDTGKNEAPEYTGGMGKEGRRVDQLHILDVAPDGLHDPFNEFDEAMEQTEPPEAGPHIRLVHAGELA